MTTKLEAARMVTREGKLVIIANGRHKRVLTRILAGEETGTIFLPATAHLKNPVKIDKNKDKRIK